MTDRDLEPLGGYETRLGQKMFELSDDAMLPFDAAAIARAVVVAHPRATRVLPMPFVALGRTMRVALAVIVLSATLAMAAAMLATVGQQRPPSVAFAPGTLAFSRAGSLVIASADGSGAVELAAGTELEPIERIAFAPDGHHLAFTSLGSECQPLVLVSADLTTRGPYGCSDRYAWSPDGQRLAVYQFVDGVWGLATIGLDGEVIDELPTPTGFAHDQGGGWLPSWSPDGRWIAIAGCVQEPCKFDHEWLLMAADGSSAHWLHEYVGTRLAWSPDSCLAVADRSGGMRVLSASGRLLRTIDLPGGRTVDRLSWSPDGMEAAATYRDDSDPAVSRLEVFGVDGSTSQVGLDSRVEIGDIGDVRWSADGSRLVFSEAHPEDEAYQLWSVPSTGGVPQHLADQILDGSFDVAPAVRPGAPAEGAPGAEAALGAACDEVGH